MATQSPPTNVRWQIVALLVAFSGVGYFNRNSIAVAGAERLMDEFELTETQMGAVYTAYLIAYTLCMVPGGWLIDRIGPKRSLMLMGFGAALLVPMTGLVRFTPAHVILTLCAIRALLGIVNAPMYPSAARSVSLWMPFYSRGMANGLVTAAAVSAIAATFFVFGFLMDLVDWPAAFMVGGIASLVLTIVWSLFATDRPADHPGVSAAELAMIQIGKVDPVSARISPESGLKSGCAMPAVSVASIGGDDVVARLLAIIRRHRDMLLLMLSYAALSYFQYMLFYWIQYYFDKVLNLGKMDGRLYATIPLIAMAIGMTSGGWLADRVQLRLGKRRGRPIVPACGMFASAILLGMGIASSNATWAVSCITLAMGALGASESSFWVTGVELGGKRGGLSAAILNTGGNAGGIPAPWLTPLISDRFGWQAGMGVASLLCFLGAGLWFWIQPESDAESEALLANAPAAE